MPESPDPGVVVEAAIAGWLQAKTGRSNSAATARAYRETLASFRTVAQAAGVALDGDVATLARLAQSWAAAGGPAPATHNQRLVILSSFYEYANARGYWDGANPARRVERRRVVAYAAAVPLAPADVSARLGAIDRATLAGARDYALLAVALQTGRRVSEVAGLEWGDLAAQGDRLAVVWRHCKGGKQMRDILPPAVTRAVVAWLRSYYGARLATLPSASPVWVSLARNGSTGQALSPRALEGICAKHLGTSKFHSTRHTFAVAMENAGAKLTEIQARLGHASAATTSLYLQQLRAEANPLADSMARLFGLDAA